MYIYNNCHHCHPVSQANFYNQFQIIISMITITTEDTNLVRSIARRYAQCNVPLQDLMQEGYIGLIYAKRHFDPISREQLSQDMNVSIEVIHKIYQRSIKKVKIFCPQNGKMTY